MFVSRSVYYILECVNGVHVKVAEMNKAIEKVKSLGIRTLGDKATIGAHNKPVIFLHPKDCGGVLLELEQA
jgi:methylmalonyl-CoA/ethylmalonyl-CoA epimerase